MKYYGSYTQKTFAYVVLVCTFCFIAFVQVSELLKNSAAFAIFFYGFTIYLTKGSKIATLMLVITSIGTHPSVIMLLPLFLYKILDTRFILTIGVIVSVFFITTDTIDTILQFLPNGQYFDMLLDRFGNYGEGQSGTKHYIALQLAMLASTLFLWFTKKGKSTELKYTINIIALYFLISILNFNNLVAYLRFSIFSHWQFALILIWLIQVGPYSINAHKVKKLLCVFMFLMTLRWTISRTVVPGGYCSSYMDNSITNIMFSTSYNYLSVDYEK